MKPDVIDGLARLDTVERAMVKVAEALKDFPPDRARVILREAMKQAGIPESMYPRVEADVKARQR